MFVSIDTQIPNDFLTPTTLTIVGILSRIISLPSSSDGLDFRTLYPSRTSSMANGPVAKKSPSLIDGGRADTPRTSERATLRGVPAPPVEDAEVVYPVDELKLIHRALKAGERGTIDTFVRQVDPDTVAAVATGLACADSKIISDRPLIGRRALHFALELGLFVHAASQTAVGHKALVEVIPSSMCAMLARLATSDEGALIEAAENLGAAVARYPVPGWIPTIRKLFASSLPHPAKQALFNALEECIRFPVGTEGLLFAALAGNNTEFTSQVFASAKRRQLELRSVSTEALLATDDPSCLAEGFGRLRNCAPVSRAQNANRLRELSEKSTDPLIQLEAFALLEGAIDRNDLGYGLTHPNPFVRVLAHTTAKSSTAKLFAETEKAIDALTTLTESSGLVRSILTRALCACRDFAGTKLAEVAQSAKVEFCCAVYLPALAQAPALTDLITTLENRVVSTTGFVPSAAAQAHFPFRSEWVEAALSQQDKSDLPSLFAHFGKMSAELKCRFVEAIIILGPKVPGYMTALAHLRSNKREVESRAPWLRDVVDDRSVPYPIRAAAQGILARSGGILTFVEELPKLGRLSLWAAVANRRSSLA